MNTQRPRASRLQFSLRAVLLLLTIAGIGGWWWQKRFKVESTVRHPEAVGRGVQFVDAKRTESQRRQGLTNVVRDGPTTVVTEQGTLILEEEWRQGVRHGIYRRRDTDGELLFECEFRRGRLVRVGDKTVSDFIHAATIDDDPAGQRILRELEGETVFDYLDQPLKEIVDDIGFIHRLPIILDRRALSLAGIAPDAPVAGHIRGVPLFVALVELFAPSGLSIAYHHQVLWVTTPDSELHQQRAASDVRTDNAAPSLLDALEQPAEFDYLDQRLQEVLDDVALRHSIAVESDLQFAAELVNLSIRLSTLRSTLGILSHMHDLRCEASGNQLVVTQIPGKLPRPQPRMHVQSKPTATPSAKVPAKDAFSKPGGPHQDPFGPPAGPFSKDAPNEDSFSGR